MPVTHIRIENYKSIKRCDLDINNLTLLIGENGSGKTSILEAIDYYYRNLTDNEASDDIYDINNSYSNEVKITLTFDLSSIVLISKTKNIELDDLFETSDEKSKYSDYFNSIIELASSSKNKTFKLQLSQIKGRPIRWSEPYEKRFILKSLFPFFYIDTRTLDVKEWSMVWNVLGELSKVSNPERNSLEKQIRDVVDNDVETSNKIKAIRSIFESSQLSVLPATTKEFASNLAKVYFSGDHITQKGRTLKYYSTGTNSVKYVELLVRSINEIARNKMKEPVILFDEPEISLHPGFIDELSDTFFTVDNRLSMIVSTHSSRLIKNLISSSSMLLYNTKIENNHTTVHLMKRFYQYSNQSRYRVLDDHINSYFSKAILFVEGETELELFSNPYLRVLFPCLECIDIFQAMSQEPILNIMNPRKNNSNVPYICLIDADKAIHFINDKRMFELKNEFFNNEKEKYLYKSKKDKNQYIRHLHTRIINMVNKLKVHYYNPFYSCNDPNYDSLMTAIHEYLLRYRVFCLKTTIEGALVNVNSMSYAISYLGKYKKSNDYSDFINLLNSYMKTDQINALRMVYNGKSDLLKSYKTIKNKLSNETALTLEKAMVGKKTSGWISDYIDNYFITLLPDGVDKSPKGMKKAFSEQSELRISIINSFKYNFPELYDIFSQLHAIINK